MDIGTGLTVFSGACVVITGILKFSPEKKRSEKNKFITVREFEIWEDGFNKRWIDLSEWIKSIHADVKTLMGRK